MAFIHGREKGILMDVLTRIGTWGLEKRWNKHAKSKREIVSSLISDRGSRQ